MKVPGRTRRWLRIPRTPPRTPHDRMVTLADRMLQLNKKKYSVPQSGIAPSELDRLERDIASTDSEIDELVYELYGITDEERKIIEGT